MASNHAEPHELAEIRRLASDLDKVRFTKTADYDLLGRHLKREELCEEIVAAIDRGERVKRVILHGNHAGQAAYELTPRIDNALLYIKVTICELGQPGELLLVISAHPPH